MPCLLTHNTMNTKLQFRSRLIFLLGVLLPAGGFFLPLWQILMWAPQYPEGLGMKIWIDNISGDVKIINALNHYIGMRNIEVDMFPEFGYMKLVVGLIILSGLLLVAINRRWSVYTYLGIMIATGMAALYDFYSWGYDYGHNLNPEAPIKVPGMAYQPPVLGTKQLLNFLAYSGPDSGGWLFIGSAVVTVLVILLEKFTKRPAIQ